MVQNWLNEKVQSVDTVIWNERRQSMNENECRSACENITSYESDEESIATRTLPLDMKSYGSFEKSTSLSESAVAEHNIVEALVNNAIMTSISEIKRETDFVRKIEMKECVKKLVLDAIGSAILEARDENMAPEKQREERCQLHREISEDTTIEARYEFGTSSSGSASIDNDSSAQEGKTPPCRYLLKRDSCEQFRLRNSRICPDRHANDVFSTVDEQTEDFDHEDKRVSFGSCKIYSYKVAKSMDLDEMPEIDDDDLDSLIESEAVALTEDAIFFAKKELYQEISAAERLVQETADKLVSKSINSALIELYSDRNSMASSDSDESRESPAQLLNELPDPADFVYTAIDVAGDPHGMLRLDSIAEESEHSECSLRSSSSNNLGLMSMQTINEPVCAGMNNNPSRNASYGQESVEIAEYFSSNQEQEQEHVTPSPIKMFIHQESLQHQPSVDSALSDAESRSLLGGNNSPYFRPQSPTPPASRLSGDNHRNRAMTWTREESRDWRSSDDDSAQESIGTSPLFNRVQKRANPFPFGSRSSTMDLDDGPIEPVFEAAPVKPQAGLNWFSMTLDEDDENNNLNLVNDCQTSEIPEFQNPQNHDQAIDCDFDVASSIASFDTVIERENEQIEYVNLDETNSTASSASIIYLKDEKAESVDYNYPASDDFDVVQVQPPTPTDGQSRALSPDFNNNEEETNIKYDYNPPIVERKQSVADLLVEKMEAQLSSTTKTSSPVIFSIDEPSGSVAPLGETQFDKFLEDVERDFSTESDAETSISNETAVEKISDIESNTSEQDQIAHVSHAVQEMDMLAQMLDNIANDLVASCLDDVIHSELFGQKDSETRNEIKRKLSVLEIADEFDPIPRESTGENEGLKRRDTGIDDLIRGVSAPPAKRSSLEIFEEDEEEEEEQLEDHFSRPNESSQEKEEPSFSTFINENQPTVKATEPICEYMTVGGDDADANETMREFGFQNPYFDMSKSVSVDSGSRGDTNEQISSPAIFTSEAQQVKFFCVIKSAKRNFASKTLKFDFGREAPFFSAKKKENKF